jgi:hypothetical protein
MDFIPVIEMAKHIRKDFIYIKTLPYKYRVPRLCDIVNYATNPYRLMTDREHLFCDRIAKKARLKLKTLPGWKETENGFLLPNK